MSALNQAFLRAYAKQSIGATPVNGGARQSRVEVESAPTAARSFACPQPLAEDIQPTAPPSGEKSRPHVDHPLYVPRHDVPLPSRSLLAARVAAGAPAHAPLPPVDPRITRGTAGPPPSAVRGPTAAYPAPATSPGEESISTSVGSLVRSNRAGNELSPAWEVDAFRWPRGCEIVWDAARQEFRDLGEQLVQVNENGLRVLGVTSVGPHEGRTTLAICLARAAAEQGLRVLLLDADLENPQLAPALGVDVRNDWTEVISEALPLDEAVVASLEDRLTLAPLLPGAAGRANLLRLPQFAEFLDQLAEVSDLVIVDLPSLDSASLPASRLGQRAPLDAVILVRDDRQTSVEHLREARRRLDRLGIVSVGVIENFVSPD